MSKTKVIGLAFVLLLSLASAFVSPAGAQQGPQSPWTVKDLADVTEGQYRWGPAYELVPGTSSSPKLLIGADQDVMVLWAAQGLHIASLDKDGNTLTEGTLDGPSSSISSWDAAISHDGIVVVWTEPSGKLMFARYDQNGVSDGSPRALSVDSSGISSPAVSVSSDGNIFITYIVSRLSGPITAYVCLRSDGTTLISAREVDLDGMAASAVDLLIGPGDLPYMLLTTDQGAYMVALDRAGSEKWHSLLFAQGQGTSQALSNGNSVIAATWLSGSGDVSVSVFNSEGSNIASYSLNIPGIQGGIDAVLDIYGALHVASSDGLSIVHTAIGIGKGILFQQQIAMGVGAAGAIKIAADQYGALYAIFQDIGTGLFYSHAVTYAFEVTVDDSTAFVGVHPGKEVAASLTITNKGGMVDALGIQYAIMPDSAGWTAELSATEVYLEKDGTVEVPFKIIAPDHGSDGDQASLFINVWAMSLPARSVDVELPLELSVIYSVSMSEPDNVLHVPPGLSESTTITVTNDGEVPENIFLSATDYSGPTGDHWGLLLSNYHLILAPSGSEDVELTVTAPYMAPPGEMSTIEVTALVQEAPWKNARSTLYAVAQSDIQLSLELMDGAGAPSMGETVLPGAATEYIIKVTNGGRSSGLVSVGLEVVSGSGDWQAYLSRDSISVGGETSVLVPLTIQAPDDALEGSRFVARIRAKGLETPVEGQIDVITWVKKVSSLSVELVNRYYESDPGSDATYSIILTNNGNGMENLLLRSETPFGWAPVRFYVEGYFHTRVPVPVGETVQVEAKVKVPIGSTTGDHELTIMVLNGHQTSLDVIAHVNMVSDIWLSALETVQEAVDGKATYEFKVKNYGNGPDDVRFVPENLPSDWTVEFPEVREVGGYLSLAQGGEAKAISMIINVPGNVHDRSVEFTVRALPMRGEGTLVRLMLKVVPTDLQISQIEFATETHVKGDIESVTIWVKNNGPGPAGTVWVRADDNGRLFGQHEIEFIRSRDVKSVTFTWAVTEGRHTLRFTVDPDDLIYEKDEANNIATVKVTAVAKTDQEPTMPVEAIAGGTVFASAAILGAAAMSTEAGRFKLIWLFWVPLYTKLKRTSILDHFIRGQVYGYIKANPGEHYNAIKKALALKNGTLVYHLQTLEREEYVKSVSDGRYKRFYPAGMKVPEESGHRINKIQEIILRLIGDRPGISQKEIAEEIGLSGATINYHINVMLQATVIKVEKIGRTTHCYAIDENGDVIEPSGAVPPVGTDDESALPIDEPEAEKHDSDAPKDQ